MKNLEFTHSEKFFLSSLLKQIEKKLTNTDLKQFPFILKKEILFHIFEYNYLLKIIKKLESNENN